MNNVPDLDQALAAIKSRADRFGISLQRAISDHLPTFDAAIRRDGASHAAVAALLFENGVTGLSGKAPSAGSVSRALHRARNPTASAPRIAKKDARSQRSSATTEMASRVSPQVDRSTPNPRSPFEIEPGAARLPIPPPERDQPTNSPMSSALRAGAILNLLKLNRVKS